ncbi:MAG: class I SAM-dependent methyltransferase [Candidatus Hodarchaeales archaeon]
MAPEKKFILGVGVSAKKAEYVRRELLKANVLHNGKKIVKEGEKVFFPVVEGTDLEEILSTVEYELEEKSFPNIRAKNNLESLVKKEFPGIFNEDLHLKYDQIGDIAVVKFDNKIYGAEIKKRIAELIISNSPKINTVLNKLDSVAGHKRIFPIEHLSGENKTWTWHQEYGIMIYCDLANAYFNPRLAEEHVRVSRSIQEGDFILDMFTGVGSFALHCAKTKKCKIVAVDINPDAIQALVKSINRNRIIGEIQPLIADSSKVFRNKRIFDRIIMNFPHKSVEYLQQAIKLVKKGGIITFYQFMQKSSDLEQKIHDTLTNSLGGKNAYKVKYFKVGREVSPSKVQLNCDVEISL